MRRPMSLGTSGNQSFHLHWRHLRDSGKSSGLTRTTWPARKQNQILQNLEQSATASAYNPYKSSLTIQAPIRIVHKARHGRLSSVGRRPEAAAACPSSWHPAGAQTPGSATAATATATSTTTTTTTTATKTTSYCYCYCCCCCSYSCYCNCYCYHYYYHYYYY